MMEGVSQQDFKGQDNDIKIFVNDQMPDDDDGDLGDHLVDGPSDEHGNADSCSISPTNSDFGSELTESLRDLGNTVPTLEEVVLSPTGDAADSKYSGLYLDIEMELDRALDARMALEQLKKKNEDEIGSLRRDLDDLELAVQKADQDRVSKDHQIRALEEDVQEQEGVVARISKEKKHLQETIQKILEDLQASEDKTNQLVKIKSRLEQTLDEVEDSLEQEKRLQVDQEKARRKLEGDLRSAQEAINVADTRRQEAEAIVERNSKEIAALTRKLRDEQALVSRGQKQIKECGTRIEELEEEVEAEKSQRIRVEKQRSDLTEELQDLSSKLEEAEGSIISHQETIKKRGVDLCRLRRDLQEALMQGEAHQANLKRKHCEALAEMQEQIESLSKFKHRAEKERQAALAEAAEVKVTADKTMAEKVVTQRELKLERAASQGLKLKLEEASRNLAHLEGSRIRLNEEKQELLNQLSESESQLTQLSKVRSSLQLQLDSAQHLAGEEAKERASLAAKLRTADNEVRDLREALEEELFAKTNVSLQLSRISSECSSWKSRYENEAMNRIDDLEGAKARLQAKLAEAEDAMMEVHSKCSGLEKAKQKLMAEVEEISLELDRCNQRAHNSEKKAENFDKVTSEWKAQAEDLAWQLEQSQSENRENLALVVKARNEGSDLRDQMAFLRRDNKALQMEIKDLQEQVEEGRKCLHDLEQEKRSLEAEREELTAALDDAEVAVEQEETKAIKAKEELARVRQEATRQIKDKEEELASVRRTQQRLIESLQTSLETEVKGKAELSRTKKKLEAEVHELELSLDRVSRVNSELQANLKKGAAAAQVRRELQCQVESDRQERDKLRDLLAATERRANVLANELEESRALQEQAEKSRKRGQAELSDCRDRLNEVVASREGLAVGKRRLEGDLASIKMELDECLHSLRSSEDRADRALAEAAKSAEDARFEQNRASLEESSRKSAEAALREIQGRLEEAEATICLREAKRVAVERLEAKVRCLTADLDNEQRCKNDHVRKCRKAERRLRELEVQHEEDLKNLDNLQEIVEKLQGNLRLYKQRVEVAEDFAASSNLVSKRCYIEVGEAARAAQIELLEGP